MAAHNYCVRLCSLQPHSAIGAHFVPLPFPSSSFQTGQWSLLTQFTAVGPGESAGSCMTQWDGRMLGRVLFHSCCMGNWNKKWRMIIVTNRIFSIQGGCPAKGQRFTHLHLLKALCMRPYLPNPWTFLDWTLCLALPLRTNSEVAHWTRLWGHAPTDGMRQETLGLIEKPSELSAHTSLLVQLVWLVEAHPFYKQKSPCRVTFALYVPLCNPEDILLQHRESTKFQPNCAFNSHWCRRQPRGNRSRAWELQGLSNSGRLSPIRRYQWTILSMICSCSILSWC